MELLCSKSKALNDSFTHRGSIVWNCLPSQLKAKPSYSSFKANIKKFFKCIDQITLGTNSTATNNNSDELSSLLPVILISHPFILHLP